MVSLAPVTYRRVAPLGLLSLGALILRRAIVRLTRSRLGRSHPAPPQPGPVAPAHIPEAPAHVVFRGPVVTADGPNAGDEQAARLDLVVADVAGIHGIAVWLLAALTVALVRVARHSPPMRRAASILLVVLAAQAAVGYTQYFTG